MAGRDEGTHRRLDVRLRHFEAIEAAAVSLDLATGVFVDAVIAGALATGSAERLALRGLEGVTTKRRPQPTLPWVASGGRAPGGRPPRATRSTMASKLSAGR